MSQHIGSAPARLQLRLHLPLLHVVLRRDDGYLPGGSRAGTILPFVTCVLTRLCKQFDQITGVYSVPLTMHMPRLVYVMAQAHAAAMAAVSAHFSPAEPAEGSVHIGRGGAGPAPSRPACRNPGLLVRLL